MYNRFMRTSPPEPLPIFRSEPQLRMLGRLLLHPDSAATMDELGKASGMSKTSVHRELRRAIDAGLVERDDRRRPHEFRAIRSSPMHGPVAALLRMTVGVEEELRELLGVTPGVDAAALHGSWADGTARPASDVDLLVVGEDIDVRRLRADLRDLGRRTGREIDLMLVPRRDFDELLRDDNPFLRIVLERPLINLVGDVAGLAVP
jgi:predicted nucleotidyltransferase